MQNMKYLVFYTLLATIVVLGALAFHWLVIFPAALLLSFAYIVVKGSTWRQVMGQSDLNTSIVFIAVLISQMVLAAVLWGVGRSLALLISG